MLTMPEAQSLLVVFQLAVWAWLELAPEGNGESDLRCTDELTAE